MGSSDKRRIKFRENRSRFWEADIHRQCGDACPDISQEFWFARQPTVRLFDAANVCKVYVKKRLVCGYFDKILYSLDVRD